ncbi:RNase P subunit p30-domain-containing protein [Coprinopsis sp. MPI-PUGE-AT-0042]|nr:RNase P subunit p30-domain-containing protein [Coprinopsis sp. MPI-PUGE-AT-0042]
MFFELNIPVCGHAAAASKKGKEKQTLPAFSAAQLAGFEAKIDILVHLGYTVIALSQTVAKKVDSKAHTNPLEALLSQLKPRPGIIFLKRLNVVLDEDSEKGFGLINANVPLFNAYDLIALVPTTHATLSAACLTHTPAFPTDGAHYLHTLIRTALKNGAVFEINYVGALGGSSDPVLVESSAAENGPSAKRNWWAAAREVVRVTKGKGIVVSSGVVNDADLRAPRDIANLITLLGLPQDAAHDASTRIPKSLVIRAETRKTYRAVLSEPTLVIPDGFVVEAEPMMNADTSLPVKRPLEDSSSKAQAAEGGKKKKKKGNPKGA